MFTKDQITWLSTREELRLWFAAHETGELFVPVNRSKQDKDGIIRYEDAVMEALCFGWIDSTLRNVDGVLIQRFSPRRRNSHWTDLNRRRVQELESAGLMTERGRLSLHRCLALLACGILCVFSSCHSTTPAEPVPVGDSVPVASTIDGVQPMTGLVMWPSHGQINRYKDYISLEYSYVLPCRVVTGKENGAIQYDWSYVEDILDDIASRNHQAILRFRYEYPNNAEVDGHRGTTAVPAYIKALPDYHETYNENAGGDGQTYYADWSNSELQWFTRQFYTDFAARYNNDPRIAFMEVGFGHWSEYHIYGTKLQLGTNFPSHAYQSSFLQHVDSVLTLPYAISIDAADDSYTPIVRNRSLMALSFGLFDDSFMHEDHEGGYNEECWDAIGKGTRWQRGVCGGEISYYTYKDQRNFLNPAGMYGHTWEEQAAKYHITFMIANDAPGSTYGTPARFQEAALAAGYRFQVLSCITNETSTTLRITNNGVAPIYYDAYLAIGESVSTTSLRSLLPQDTTTITLPCHCAAGEDIHIVCPHLLPSQHIGFEGNCP